jgi:hypothetical protein
VNWPASRSVSYLQVVDVTPSSAPTLAKLPDPGTEGSSLRAADALSPDDVWAVGITGQTDGGSLALIEHFNGTGWSISPALDPGQLAEAPTAPCSASRAPARARCGPSAIRKPEASAAPGPSP